MSDGSCHVFGLLSILRYQQNIRAWSAPAVPINGPWRSRSLLLLPPSIRYLPEPDGFPERCVANRGHLNSCVRILWGALSRTPFGQSHLDDKPSTWMPRVAFTRADRP